MPIQTAQFGFVPPKQGTHDESGGYEHLTGKTDMSAEKITPPSDDDRDKQDWGKRSQSNEPWKRNAQAHHRPGAWRIRQGRTWRSEKTPTPTDQ